jgi:hypothetical protein
VSRKIIVRLPLKRCSTILLRRHFNTATTISDSSPLYVESVQMIISMAINVSVRLIRVPGTSPENRPLSLTLPMSNHYNQRHFLEPYKITCRNLEQRLSLILYFCANLQD